MYAVQIKQCDKHFEKHFLHTINCVLNSHLHLNGGMRVVVADLKVVCTEIIDTLHCSQDLQRGEGADLPLQLYFKRFDVVQVDVSVSQSVNKVTRLESCDVCDHVRKKCIAGDVERHPQAHITRALVQLTRQLAVTHVELAQGVAGGQSHEGQVFGVPGAHDDPSVLWILFDGVNDLLQLVDTLSCVICVHVCVLGTKVPPLETIHRAQVALLSLCEPKVVQEFPGTIGLPNLHPFL